MSTRTQIEFRGYSNRRVYKHHDGYPKYMFDHLQEFLQWNLGRNTDIEYMAANYIYWAKTQEVKKHGEHVRLTGFGVCDPDCEHGDIDYFYIVDTQNKEIECRKKTPDGKVVEIQEWR